MVRDTMALHAFVASAEPRVNLYPVVTFAHRPLMGAGGTCLDRRMNRRHVHRSVLGILAGGMASALWVPTLGHPQWSVLLGIVVGVAYAAIWPATRGALCGSSLGRWCAGSAPLGTAQRHRIPAAFRADAPVERRADASTLPSVGWLGTVWLCSASQPKG